jgi:hypothetical protein
VSVRRFPKHELTAAGLLWMALTAVRAGAQAIPVSTARDLLATHPRPFAELLETARPAPVSAKERARILASLPREGVSDRLVSGSAAADV